MEKTSFKGLIQEYMEKRNFKQADVAFICNIESSGLSRLLAPGSNLGLTANTLLNIMRGLEIPYSELARVETNFVHRANTPRKTKMIKRKEQKGEPIIAPEPKPQPATVLDTFAGDISVTSDSSCDLLPVGLLGNVRSKK